VHGSQPLVSLVTVNYNGRALLETFLQSVDAQEFPAERLELIVVDNGSSDGSAEFVRERFPSARVIENSSNLGFATANNQGADCARGRYLALLNNDMRLDPRWVGEMVRYLERQSPELVCAGSLILSWDGTQIDFGGSTMAFNGVGFQLHAGALPEQVQDYPERILFPCGGAMMIERDVYLEAGGFDGDFFAYLEDVDLGWRLWLLGYEVGFCHDAVTYHLHNATSRLFAEYRKNVLVERNALASMIKNYGDDTLAVTLPAALLLAVKRMALRSRIQHSEFAFISERALAAPPARRRTPLQKLHSFVRAFRDFGPRVALSLVWRKFADRLPSRAARPAAAPDARPISLGAYATVVAIVELIDNLPGLLERRRAIQAVRRRSDEEIFRVLETPFRHQQQGPEHAEDYEATFQAVVNLLGVRERFEIGLPTT
jgi:GT2 family glycosyltransferase